MSFIYDDPKLMQKLLLSGLGQAVKFTKKGQVAASAVQQDRANLLALVRNLQDQLNPAGVQQDPNAAPQISYESDVKPTMDVKTLESLGDLVKWLAANKISINGQRVAYDTDPGDRKNYVPYKLQTHMTDPAQRDQAPGQLFVNVALLKTYVVQLQAYEQKNPNPTMKFQLGRLIDEANKNLGAEISEQYQEQDKVLRDIDMLDRVPQNFVDTKTSITGGQVDLTYGDMKDDMSFNKWLVDKSIGYQGKMVNHPEFNRCAVLDILAVRAKLHYSGAQDAVARDRATIYVRQVSSVKQQANCPSQQGDQGAPDMQGGQQGQGGSMSAGQMREVVSQIIDTRPFDLQNIDFPRINTFFGLIAQLMPNQGAVIKTIGDVKSLMQQASGLTANGEDHFSLGIPATSIINMLRPNARTGFPAANLPAFVSYLRRVLDATRAVYDHFYQQYANMLTPEQRAMAQGQVGARPGDDSIYKQNLEYLNQWNLPVR